MKATCDDFNERVDKNKADIASHEEKIGKINSEIKQMKAYDDNLQH